MYIMLNRPTSQLEEHAIVDWIELDRLLLERITRKDNVFNTESLNTPSFLHFHKYVSQLIV